MYRYLCGAVAPRVRQSELLVRAAYGGPLRSYRHSGLGPARHALPPGLCAVLPGNAAERNGHQSAGVSPPAGPAQVQSHRHGPPMSKFPNPSSPLQTISLHLNATDAQRGSVSSSISPFDAPIRPLATAISPSEPSSNALTPPEAEPEPDPEPDGADADTDTDKQRGRDGDGDDIVPCG
ncbi:hypothetical protein Trihar35433_5048 [Trichoderma harzianum]|nr:hypothetical protein Trihar35433_5048 [Trichoderma harzianum]